MDWDDDPNSLPELDLHGLAPDRALRRLASELRTCRVRGDRVLLVITGRGYGNRLQQPILRGRVEAWLEGPEARALGALAFGTWRLLGILKGMTGSEGDHVIH